MSWISSLLIVLLLFPANISSAKTGEHGLPVLVQPNLTAPGSTPFHLRAELFEGRERTPQGTVDIYWISPTKWRWAIDSDDIKQTVVTNGHTFVDSDSDAYFPVGLRTLVQAMTDPSPILETHREGDQLLTLENGASRDSGLVCFDPERRVCMMNPRGLTEIVGCPGYQVTFTNYKPFGELRVAREIQFGVGVGEVLTADVTELERTDMVDEKLFATDRMTEDSGFVHTVNLHEAELRSLLLQKTQIVWPQPLDGAITGTSTYLVSVDREGQVREVLPVKTANERANDSARRQIMRWKVKPVVIDGHAAQAESLMSFEMDTRAFGPAEPLKDADVRKLATNLVEPEFKGKKLTPGATKIYRIAVDDEGKLIEAIAGDGPSEMSLPCYNAIKEWKFSPVMENGQPRPYRGEVICLVK